MKGIVFVELLNMIKINFGEDMVGDVLDDCNLASGGAYTTAAVYDHREMIEIVNKLSAKTGIKTLELTKNYGFYLFSRFHTLMPEFFTSPKNSFEFLESVDQTIHVEVKKLYPDAQLPKFDTSRPSKNELEIIYKSKCPFANFAHGLILGCINHFAENIGIEYEDKNTEEYFSRVFRLNQHGS